MVVEQPTRLIDHLLGDGACIGPGPLNSGQRRTKAQSGVDRLPPGEEHLLDNLQDLRQLLTLARFPA
jgi:hypothetical protein